MEVLIIFYYVNISITTVLAVLAVYTIIYASTIEMDKFKWLLLFIAVSIYSESLFFTVFFAPVIPVHPLPYVYSTGILWTIFRVPVNVQWGIMVFCLGIMVASIVMSFTHRYAMLLPLSPWGASLNPSIGRYMKLGVDCTVVISGVAGGSLALFCFKTAEETKKLILEMDSTEIVPESAQTFEYGLATQIWGFYNASALIIYGPAVTFIVVHSNRILKSAASSERTIAMHKEAIRSLIIQAMAMLAVANIPVSIFGFCLTWHMMIGQLPSSMFILSVFGAGLFSMQSFFGSIAILTTIKVYRVYLTQKIYFWRPKDTRVGSLASNPSSVPT